MSRHPLFQQSLREVLVAATDTSIYSRYLKEEHLRTLLDIVLRGYPDCEDEYFEYINSIKDEYSRS